MKHVTYSVYVKTNEAGYITAVNSSAFLKNTEGWIKIDEGHTHRFHHAQGNYLPESILTERGSLRYKLVNGVVERIEEQEVPETEVPSLLDRIEAQLTYTAMMTDTLLEV